MGKAKTKRRKSPFATWRVLCQQGSRRFSVDQSGQYAAERVDSGGDFGGFGPLPEFDELVVGSTPCLVHIERMDANSLFVGLGPDVTLSVWKDRTGNVSVRLQEGVVDGIGVIHPHGWKPKGRAKR